jgi:hypothetical protein
MVEAETRKSESGMLKTREKEALSKYSGRAFIGGRNCQEA